MKLKSFRPKEKEKKKEGGKKKEGRKVRKKERK